MSVATQPLLDEVRRLAAFVNAAGSTRELRFTNHLTLAYLNAESGAQEEFRSELRAPEEGRPRLASRLRASPRGRRACPTRGGRRRGAPARLVPREGAELVAPRGTGSQDGADSRPATPGPGRSHGRRVNVCSRDRHASPTSGAGMPDTHADDHARPRAPLRPGC